MNANDNNVVLETKLVGDIEGSFFIPSYQRGYRWGKEEVTRLLDDVYTAGLDKGETSYCLQPIVIRRHADYYELIDGQQRLTTLFLIYKFMEKGTNGWLDPPRFSLVYETREKSESFLSELDLQMREENIDFWFICNAYEAVEDWFSERKPSAITDINSLFDKRVKVIWYEVGNDEDPIALFTRLNVGKIPLTSSELVKALFLSKDANSDMDRRRQEEIALQWDSIERDLHDSSLWYFLTNQNELKSQTRIDLVLDLIANKPFNNRDAYYTFFSFDRMRETDGLENVWRDIQNTFLTLKGWYENHDLYHLVGYLIASESKSLQELYALSIGKTKDAFFECLNDAVCDSIEDGESYGDMSYEKQSDKPKMERLLFLFNVESVRQIDGKSQRFPFDKHKRSEDGLISWSLEHIHAQQSEGMKTQEEWKKWLESHVPFVQLAESTEGLSKEMMIAAKAPTLTRDRFESLQGRAVSLLSEVGPVEYMHTISNMALLSSNDNAALNNSTFAVKRDLVIDMDTQGKYIPFCTKMVFLKYYTPSKHSNVLFWGHADRIAYIQAMNRTLSHYLNCPIPVEEGE